MHPLAALHLHRTPRVAHLAGLGDTADDIAQAVVDTVVPALQNRMPDIAQSLVNEAMPRVKAKLTELQPELTELAREAARQVVADDQVQAAVKQAADKATARITTGFVLLGLLTVGCTAAVLASKR